MRDHLGVGMSMITYSYTLDNGRDMERLHVSFPRPVWWKESTSKMRSEMERKALGDKELKLMLISGFRIVDVTRPICECAVNRLPQEERDPYWIGANATCKRCSGPLPKKGKRKNR